MHVFPNNTKFNNWTNFDINLASDVPPEVLSSGSFFVTFFTALTIDSVNFSEKLKKDSPDTLVLSSNLQSIELSLFLKINYIFRFKIIIKSDIKLNFS